MVSSVKLISPKINRNKKRFKNGVRDIWAWRNQWLWHPIFVCWRMQTDNHIQASTDHKNNDKRPPTQKENNQKRTNTDRFVKYLPPFSNYIDFPKKSKVKVWKAHIFINFRTPLPKLLFSPHITSREILIFLKWFFRNSCAA